MLARIRANPLVSAATPPAQSSSNQDYEQRILELERQVKIERRQREDTVAQAMIREEKLEKENEELKLLVASLQAQLKGKSQR